MANSFYVHPWFYHQMILWISTRLIILHLSYPATFKRLVRSLVYLPSFFSVSPYVVFRPLCFSLNLKIPIYHCSYVAHLQVLAEYDIIVTTFATLRLDFNYVLADETCRTLRRPKKYIALPCPLLALNFWRLCIDEAQVLSQLINFDQKVSKSFSIPSGNNNRSKIHEGCRNILLINFLIKWFLIKKSNGIFIIILGNHFRWWRMTGAQSCLRCVWSCVRFTGGAWQERPFNVVLRICSGSSCSSHCVLITTRCGGKEGLSTTSTQVTSSYSRGPDTFTTCMQIGVQLNWLRKYY